MKKTTKRGYFMVLWLIIFLYTTNTFAEEYSVGTIDVKFCNYDQITNELDLTTQAGEKTPICVQFTNTADTKITINTEFLDSSITDDKTKNRACNASDRPKTNFGNFLVPYVGEVILGPKETIKKEYNIVYPVWFSWLSHGCLAYNVIGADIKNSDMFTIRIRSVKFIDMLVSNTEAIQTLIISQAPTIQKTGDEYNIQIWITNSGNVDEKIDITSKIFNRLGYEKENIFSTIIPANSGIIYTTPNFILPAYGWFFLVNNKLSYTPEFNFNITDGDSSISNNYQWGTKKIQKMLFVWTRTSGILIFIIIFLISRIIRKQSKKRKKII